MDTSVVSCWLYVDVLGFESLAGWLARGVSYRPYNKKSWPPL